MQKKDNSLLSAGASPRVLGIRNLPDHRDPPTSKSVSPFHWARTDEATARSPLSGTVLGPGAAEMDNTAERLWPPFGELLLSRERRSQTEMANCERGSTQCNESARGSMEEGEKTEELQGLWEEVGFEGGLEG